MVMLSQHISQTLRHFFILLLSYFNTELLISQSTIAHFDCLEVTAKSTVMQFLPPPFFEELYTLNLIRPQIHFKLIVYMYVRESFNFFFCTKEYSVFKNYLWKG